MKTINHSDNDGKTGRVREGGGREREERRERADFVYSVLGVPLLKAEHPPLEKFKRYTF